MELRHSSYDGAPISIEAVSELIIDILAALSERFIVRENRDAGVEILLGQSRVQLELTPDGAVLGQSGPNVLPVNRHRKFGREDRQVGFKSRAISVNIYDPLHQAGVGPTHPSLLMCSGAAHFFPHPGSRYVERPDQFANLVVLPTPVTMIGVQSRNDSRNHIRAAGSIVAGSTRSELHCCRAMLASEHDPRRHVLVRFGGVGAIDAPRFRRHNLRAASISPLGFGHIEYFP